MRTVEDHQSIILLVQHEDIGNERLEIVHMKQT